MATNFPGSLDTLTNPTSSNTLDSPAHSTQHSNANDAIEALEAKVGIDSSAVDTSHDKRITDLRALTYPASSFTAGDILYASSTTQLSKLAKGAANRVLKMDSGGSLPAWSRMDGVLIYHSVAHSYADGVAQQLAMDTESFDDNTMHDNVTANTKVTIKQGGRYIITGQIAFTGNDATGTRAVALKLDGNNLAYQHVRSSNGGSMTVVQCSAVASLSANSYLEIQGTCSGTTCDDIAGVVNTFLVVQQVF